MVFRNERREHDAPTGSLEDCLFDTEVSFLDVVLPQWPISRLLAVKSFDGQRSMAVPGVKRRVLFQRIWHKSRVGPDSEKTYGDSGIRNPTFIPPNRAGVTAGVQSEIPVLF